MKKTTMEMKTYVDLDSNEMVFIDEIATQITEMNFGADAYYNYKFTDEAQDYYNEMYDEYEDLYIRMILQIPNKI